MLTIAAICDSHFSARIGGRLNECNRVHHWIADDIAKRKVQLLAHGGDVFHAQSRPEERLAVRDWIERLPVPLLIVAGNHDAPRDLVGLEPYGKRRAVHVIESPEIVNIAGLHVACLPDLRRDALVGAIIARGEQPTSEVVSAEARAIIASLGHGLATAPQGKRLFLAHGMIRGSLKGGDQPRTHGDDLVLTAADFVAVPADAFVFGHVHRGQRLPGFPAMAFYVGSPYATTYAELEPKRYVLLRFDGGRVEVEPVPIPATPMICLLGTWTGADLALTYGPEHDAGDETPTADKLRGADVRLRYTVPTTDETAVDGAANAARVELIAAGAVNVKLDPMRQRVVKLRAPEYRKATTLVERLDAYWSVCGGIDDAKRERVVALLPELAGDVPTVSGGLVRVESVTVSGLGALTNESTLNLADWGGVVALTGENGVGKSTLTGLLPAIIAGESPTHGALVDLASADGALLEGVVETVAGKWRIRHEPVHGTSTVYSMDGRPVCSGGRNTYRAWARQWLPDPRSLGLYFTLRSRSVGLAALYDANLQEALLRALGSYHLDAWATAARKRANALENEIRELDGALVGAPFDASVETSAHEAAEDAVIVAREALDDTRTAHAARVAWDDRRKALQEALRRANNLRAAVEQARKDVGDADAVRQAAASLGPTRELLLQATTEAQRAEHDVATHAATIKRIEGEQRRIEGELAAVKRRGTDARHDLGQKDAVHAAMARLPERHDAVAAAQAAIDAATAELDELVAAHQAGLRGRVVGLRGHVQAIHDTTRDVDDADTALLTVQAQCTKATRLDDAAVADDDGAIRAARAAKQQAEQALRTATTAEADDAQLAARTDVVARAEQQLAEALETHAKLTATAEALRAELATARDGHTAASVAKEAATKARAQHQNEVQRLERQAARLATIAKAEATLAALEADLAVANTEAETAKQAVDAEPALVTVADVATAEQKLERATTVLGMATARLERARADAAKAVEQRTRRAALAERCDDYTTLEVALGRHGVQAIEVEHEGEVIAAETTERLQDVLGSRWAVQFEATRPDGATGKRMIEQARWAAFDGSAVKGREIRACSDGEQALMGTAMFLAVASSMARRWGHVDGATMAFDETALSLRGDNVDAWVAMVRRGMEDLRIGTLLLVPPDAPAVTAMADVRLVVANGGITMARE